MDTKKGLFAAVILSVSIVIFGVILKAAIDNHTYNDRCVVVKGLAEMEVPADKVIHPLVYKEIGDDLQEIYATLNRKNSMIVDFLKKAGIDAADISVSAPEVVDMQAERYTSEHPKYRYNVTSVVMINSKNIDVVRQIIEKQSELMSRGIVFVSGDYRYTTLYEFTDLNRVKPQMIEYATKNARAAAEKFAADSNSKLGKIKTATQGQFTIYDRDTQTPQIKRIRVVTTVVYYLED